jgi:sugar phosphate isomerase/epimerase
MKYSAFSITMPEWDPFEAARNLKALGYDGVSLRIVDQAPSDVPSFWVGNRATWPLTGLEASLPEIRRMVAESGIKIAALYGYPRWCDRDALERHFAAAAALGVKACRFVGSGPKTMSGPRPQLGAAPYDRLFEETRRDFEWIVACALGYGVRAIVPLHHEWVIASASAARRLLDGLDPTGIGIIADWGHLAIEGWEDPLSSVQILGPYLDSVMLKNFGWFPGSTLSDGTVLWEFRPETLRRGRVDIYNVFAALQAEKFEGWVTIAEVTTQGSTWERLVDALDFVKGAEAFTQNAKASEWTFAYAPAGSKWAGLHRRT